MVIVEDRVIKCFLIHIEEYLEHKYITSLLVEHEKKLVKGEVKYLTPSEVEKELGIDLSSKALANLPDEEDEFY